MKHSAAPRSVSRPWMAGWRSRRALWTLLVLLLVSVLATLGWLAARYESNEVQSQLERDTTDVVSDIRTGLTRNVQNLLALQAGRPDVAAWQTQAAAFLAEHRELLRLEWRDAALVERAHADTPFRPPAFEVLGRSKSQPDVALACSTARRFNSAAYSANYFLAQRDNLGVEVMELCIPLASGGQTDGFVVATYALPEILTGMVGSQLVHNQELTFAEADGARLALRGAGRRGTPVFTARQLLDLPGNTLVVRMDSGRAAPGLFPNLMLALVALMSLALVAVTVLLARDTRLRQRAEHDLAEALAFRKAMEDSLLTGLRARDLQGRITYVNPAFCQMVGFSPDELRGAGMPAPYWPADLVVEYQQRQQIRLAGNAPPREGFTSVFMRKDGSRFPVLVIEAALIDAQGAQTGWMSAVVDITEQRRVEELSRASQDRLQATARLATVGEMASLLGHELNQPLAAISSYAAGSLNLLQAGQPADGDLAMALRRIAEQAERAGKVIKSVHDFVRRRGDAREAVSAQVLLDAILPLVQLQAHKLGVQVVVDVEPGLPPVLCDRTMVEQVLLNLARNGMQAMDLPGLADRVLLLRVVQAGANLRASRSTGWLEFAVADRGPGISAEVAERLFTPFFTTKDEGMGLGLSLCRTVVEQHGGFLSHDPNRPQGTVFRFTLPTA